MLCKDGPGKERQTPVYRFDLSCVLSCQMNSCQKSTSLENYYLFQIGNEVDYKRLEKVCKRVIMSLNRTQTKYNVQIKKEETLSYKAKKKKSDMKAQTKKKKEEKRPIHGCFIDYTKMSSEHRYCVWVSLDLHISMSVKSLPVLTSAANCGVGQVIRGTPEDAS